MAKLKTNSIYVPFKYVSGTDMNKIDNMIERYITERIIVHDCGFARGLVSKIDIYKAKELKTKLDLTAGLPLVYQMMDDIVVYKRENNSRLKDTLKLRFRALNHCNILFEHCNGILFCQVYGLDRTLPIVTMYTKQHNPQYPKLSSITINKRGGNFIFLT